MSKIDDLLAINKQWAESIKAADPEFFEKLSEIQAPEYLWIGCSDSRITPATSFGLLPGEMFVHRNVANLVNHSDMNCLSVMQFAVEVLKVKHIIVCGHYGCGGVEAAWKRTPLGLIDNWLRHVQDVADRHSARFTRGMTDGNKVDRLCELNVLEQGANVCRTTIVQDAWRRGQPLQVHGWIYRLQNGLIRDLGMSVARDAMLDEVLERSLRGVAG